MLKTGLEALLEKVAINLQQMQTLEGVMGKEAPNFFNHLDASMRGKLPSNFGHMTIGPQGQKTLTPYKGVKPMGKVAAGFMRQQRLMNSVINKPTTQNMQALNNLTGRLMVRDTQRGLDTHRMLSDPRNPNGLVGKSVNFLNTFGKRV